MNWRELVRSGASWVVRRWDETRPASEYDRDTARYKAQAGMLEAKIRRDLAPELTEAEIRKLIQIYQAKPEGIVELAEKIKRVVEQRAAALAGVLDPQARALIEKAFDAELKALAYRGPV